MESSSLPANTELTGMKTYQAFLKESLSTVLVRLLQQFSGIQSYVVMVEMYFGMKTNFILQNTHLLVLS